MLINSFCLKNLVVTKEMYNFAPLIKVVSTRFAQGH